MKNFIPILLSVGILPAFLWGTSSTQRSQVLECNSLKKIDTSEAVSTPHKIPSFLETLTSEKEYRSLARTVRVGGEDKKVVKILYHRKGPKGPQLYFINTKEFEFHDLFAEAHTGFKGTEEDFNKNYQGGGEDREYNQGSLVFSKTAGKEGQDKVLLEIWTGDSMDAKHIRELHAVVKEKLKMGAELVFHPLSVEQEKIVTTSPKPIPFVTTEELYQNRTYLPLNEGVAYGYIKIIDPHDPDPLLGISDIAIFDNVPNDIGLVGGVITGEFQTPLSHVNVKSINRGTLNMALINARELFAKYAGKPIELIAEGNTYKVRELPEQEAQRLIADFWKTKKPKAGEKPQSFVPKSWAGKLQDLTTYYTKLPTHAEHQTLIRSVGAKAANLALIHVILKQSTKIDRVTSPPPFASHFGFYDSFMKLPQRFDSGERATPEKLILEILNRNELLNPNLSHPIEKVRPALEQIRNIILSAKVPDQMIQEFKKAIFENPSSAIHYAKQPFLLLRSSTNSEDMIGFSGAGLYNSTLVRLYDADANGKLTLRSWSAIEKDLREEIPYVYSSVWNERAYLEREWYSVNGQQHLDVKAAIAIHGGFNGTVKEGKIEETANGVAITTNIYNPSDKSKIYINGQHYGLSVTNPPSKEELKKYGMREKDRYLTEELLVTNFIASLEEREKPDAWKKWPYEKRQSSTVKKNTPVFKNDEEVRRLAVVLDRISKSMAAVYEKPPGNFIADIEWNIFGADRTISINQSRPFTPPGQH